MKKIKGWAVASRSRKLPFWCIDVVYVDEKYEKGKEKARRHKDQILYHRMAKTQEAEAKVIEVDVIIRDKEVLK